MINLNNKDKDSNIKIEELELRLKLALRDYHEIKEEDFYPPEDNRQYHSLVCDIENGDNFYDYMELFYELYEDEIFD